MTVIEERTWNNIDVDEEHRKILRIEITSEMYQSLLRANARSDRRDSNCI